MLARLGHVLYWLGCGLAAVALVSGVFVLQHGLDQDSGWVVYVASIRSAVACWLIGRACKIFSGGRMSWPKRGVRQELAAGVA
jgi:hypothetical protein